MKKNFGKTLISLASAVILVTGISVTALADKVVVHEPSVKIRASSSTSSTHVSTGTQNDEYEIVETVTGDDGNTWYKVKYSESSTGYIRGDLVTVKKDESAQTTTTEDTSATTASSLAPTNPTAITETTATIGGNSAVNIRSGAGTEYEKVASVDAGTSITLIGEANDASGNKWYQFKCDSQNVEGYIRSDLITVSTTPEPIAEGEGTEGIEGTDAEGMIDEAAEQEPEEPYIEEPEEPQGGDYEIVYTTDDDGVYQYYLYDHINNTRQKVNELLGAITTLNTNYQEVSSKLSLFKILTIVFGVLLAGVAVLAVFLFIKARNPYEEEYYEDDFEDEEEEPVRKEPSRNLRSSRYERPSYQEREANDNYRQAPPRAAAPEKRPQAGYAEDKPQRRPAREERVEERPARRPRKAQNFLADDDEFEFEFLNMDDKE